MRALVIQHGPAALGPMSVASTPAGPQWHHIVPLTFQGCVWGGENIRA